MKAIEDLSSVVSPPATPKGVAWSAPAWLEVGRRLGTRLPADFVKYHEVYGLGNFNSLTHPTSGYLHVFGGVHDVTIVSTIARVLAELRLQKERRPNSISQPLYWEPNGLLPWGRAGNNTHLCWAVSGELVDNWPIVVVRPASAQYERYEMCMAEFLASVFSNRLDSELMPNGLPGKRGVEFKRSEYDNYHAQRDA